MSAAEARINSSRGAEPPRVSGGLPLLGHLLELRRAPIALMQRVHDECGEIGEMRLGRQPVVMLYGEQAQEEFFRAPEDQLDQAAAYPFMKPVFGKGVVFDATPEQRKQAMRNQSLRDQYMRGHAEVIAAETETLIADWGETGEIDLLDFFSELTIYTSSSCLLGKEFRAEITPEFGVAYRDLERGTDAFAFVNPYLPLPSFRRRDRARRRLVALTEEILRRRKSEGREVKDLLAVLTQLRHEDGTRRYTVDQITGMFISMMFAGHHTSAGTAAWTLIELLRNPKVMGRVVGELDHLYADGRDVSYQALRDIPELECAIKETLRLHPPLILLMRKVQRDFDYRGFTVRAGKTLAVSPAISNRMPESFPDPERFDPGRYRAPRHEDRSFAWIPFGGGRHRCVGSAFAMIQLKAIFSVILRRYDLRMGQPTESYRNDHSKMVVQLRQPCCVRYEMREPEVDGPRDPAHSVVGGRPAAGSFRVRVDLELCQGHGVCAAEAPEVFGLHAKEPQVVLAREECDADSRARVEAAVRYCPTHALSIVED